MFYINSHNTRFISFLLSRNKNNEAGYTGSQISTNEVPFTSLSSTKEYIELCKYVISVLISFYIIIRNFDGEIGIYFITVNYLKKECLGIKEEWKWN